MEKGNIQELQMLLSVYLKSCEMGTVKRNVLWNGMDTLIELSAEV